MEFIRLASMDDGAAPLYDRLHEELSANKNVLWLVTGGSSMRLSVRVMEQITEAESDRLQIYLTDERYGDIGHADSNARQLMDAGFDPKRARQVNVLAKDLSLEETCEQYALSIGAAFEAADVVIAQLGMGADGHILGVLPETPAVASDKLVVGYVTDTFTRITLTLKGLQDNVDAAYVFAFGDNKSEALSNLLSRDLPTNEQPAQILKKMPEVYVYNDQFAS